MRARARKANWRVFLGLREVAGFSGRLKKGFEENNVKCLLLNLRGDAYRHNPDFGQPVSIAAQKLQQAARAFASTPAGLLCRIAFLILRVAILVFSLIYYDAFVFVSGESIFSLRELFLYRLAKKRVIFIFLGSDGRPLFLNGFVASRARGIAPEECYLRSRKQKERIRRIEKYADIVISHPPSSQYLEKPFVPIIRIGMPSLGASCFSAPAGKMENPGLRIVHAPTFPECKGTAQIRKIVAEVKESGVRVEYIELTGKPHSHVLQELAMCDFVIDELYSDTCLAGLATEAASLGKPSVIGSYADYQSMGLREDDKKPPSVFVRPEEVQSTVKAIVHEKERLITIGNEARRFVIEEWSPKRVAARILKLISGEIPQEWLFDPREITYVHGWGFPVETQRAYLREIMKHHPLTSFGISDKPKLMAAIAKFCESRD